MTNPEAEKREVISVSAYRSYLLETRWDYQLKCNSFDGLLGRLDVALDDDQMIVHCYETDDDVYMVTFEKGELGFLGKPPIIPEAPENSVPISINQYREVLEQGKENCESGINSIDNLLEALNKALENDDLRISCYRDPDGVGMHTEEKGRVEFTRN